MKPEKTSGIEKDTMYTATITFRSVGDSIQVLPESSYSHMFPDDYEGEYPAAFLCVRDINLSLARMTQLYGANQDVSNLDELLEDEEFLADEDKQAALSAFIEATSNKGSIH